MKDRVGETPVLVLAEGRAGKLPQNILAPSPNSENEFLQILTINAKLFIF
jgi:hypothetical protein